MFVVFDENLCVKCIKDVFEYALDFTLYNKMFLHYGIPFITNS